MMSRVSSRSGLRRLVSVVQALCLVTLVVAEPFYQRRDHLDQTRYLKVHNDNVVKDRDDAEFVLSKYGYLRCQIKRRRREAERQGRGGGGRPSYAAASRGDGGPAPYNPGFNPWGDHFVLSEEGGLDVCDEAEVQKAIQEYQRTYNLAPTGVLDEETKLLMSTSRCGNKDNEKEVVDAAAASASASAAATTTTANNAAPASHLHPSPPSSSSSQASVADNVQGISSSSGASSSHHHHHQQQQYQYTSDESNKSGGVASSQRLWKRAVNRIRADDPSQLLRVLKRATSPQDAALARHRRHLQEYVSRLPRGDPALLKPWSEDEHGRAKRSIQMTATGDGEDLMNMVKLQISEHRGPGLDVEEQHPNNEMFNKEVIRWRLLNTGYSTRIPVEDQRATLDLAFRMWSEVIPLRFIEDTDSHINRVDIEVAFGRGSHQNCEHDFDGNGGEIAHSQHAGDMHFDDEENFRSIGSYTPDGIYLLRVAVHEIGHVLGLSHTNRSQSIMYAIYHGTELSPDFELSREDRKEIQKIYGVCKGQFSTVFDWVRKRPDNQFIYNTYFFRENHYWMYENHANRTRYGDPLYIAREWDGVPDKLDGYLHIWYFTGTDIINEAYFFKGEHYHKYDSENDRVYEGWPRLIRDGFGPRSGQSEAVPNNLDSVFFDMRDKNIYFFKDDMVYVYDPKEPLDTQGCCLRKRKITEEFPPASDNDPPLPDRLDAVYYSYGDRMQYFIKGENLWRNRVFDPRQRRIVNSVEFMGKWYDKWLDICDVQAQ